MDAVLDVPKTTYECNSIEGLQQQLRQLLEDAVTPTRARHLSLTFELRSSVTLHVDLSDAEVEAIGPAARTVDASVGEASPGAAAGHADGLAHAPRLISANDTLVNQPPDNPVLQRAVARNLIGALSHTNDSSWIVREVSRGAQGWTFVYICKDSSQAWKRQSSKRTVRAIASTAKDGSDPVLLGRPAFDCRGSVTISFLKATRAVQVKYEHTALHKSVAQMMELLEPPPAPITPASKRAAELDLEGEGSQEKGKNRRRTDGAAGEESQPARKKRRKTAGDVDGGAVTTEAAEGTGKSRPRPKRVYKKRPKQSNAEYNGDAAQGGGDASADAPGTGAGAAVLQPQALNLPLGEAQRRRTVAEGLLTDNQIDRATLSEEQFMIFANQSPELQTESLAMLAKYGAERLRIVHPNRDSEPAPDSDAPAASQPAAEAAPAGGQNGDGVVDGATPATVKQGTGRKKKSDVAVDGAQETDGTPRRAAAKSRTPKVKETRGPCQQCRTQRLKCAKERPSCSNCLGSGVQCYYPLAKPRAKSGNVGGAAEDGAQPEMVDVVDVADDEEPDDLPSPGFSLATAYPAPVEPAPMPMDTAPMVTAQTATQSYHSNQADPTFPTLEPHARPDVDYSAQQQTASNLPDSHPAVGWAILSEQAPSLNPPAAAVATQPPASSPATSERPASRHRSRKSANNVTADPRLAHEYNSHVASPLSRLVTPPQMAPQPGRSKSRQTQRGQTRTPVAEKAPAQCRQPPPQQQQQQQQRQQQQQQQQHYQQQQEQQVPLTRPVATQPEYSSSSHTPATATGHAAALSGYNATSQYPNGTAEQDSSRIAYEPYTHPATSTTTYPSFDGYSSRSGGATPAAGLSTTSAHVAGPYPSATTTTTASSSQWNPVAQSRNSASYSNNNLSAAAKPYSQATTRSQSPALQRQNNVLRQAPAASLRGTSASAQQQQQQHQQQQQEEQPQRSSHDMYSAQTQAPSSNFQQQQWYGFPAASATSTAYGTTSRDTSSGGAGAAPYSDTRSHGSTLQYGHLGWG